MKAISYNADVIIMDEPTSALSDSEIQYLLKMVRLLCSQGKAIVFISHKLEEVYGVCNRVTILRDGHFIHSGLVSEISEAQMIKYMVNRDVSELYPKQEAEIGEVVLEVKNLTRAGEFKDVSFTLRKGEILGFAGLVGAGRTEAMQNIFGLTKRTAGSVKLYGKEVEFSSPLEAMREGIGLVPEDRKKIGQKKIGDG